MKMMKRFSGYLNTLYRKKNVKKLINPNTEEQKELVRFLQRDLDNIAREQDAKQYIKALIELTYTLGVYPSISVKT